MVIDGSVDGKEGAGGVLEDAGDDELSIFCEARHLLKLVLYSTYSRVPTIGYRSTVPRLLPPNFARSDSKCHSCACFILKIQPACQKLSQGIKSHQRSLTVTTQSNRRQRHQSLIPPNGHYS